MRQQNKKTRKAAARVQPSLFGDWQSFRALQEAVYKAQGKQVPVFDF